MGCNDCFQGLQKMKSIDSFPQKTIKTVGGNGGSKGSGAGIIFGLGLVALLGFIATRK